MARAMRPTKDGSGILLRVPKNDLALRSWLDAQPVTTTWDKRAQGIVIAHSSETPRVINVLSELWNVADSGSLSAARKWANDRSSIETPLVPKTREGWHPSLFDHQIAAAERMIELEKCWLADDVGLGKTATFLSAAHRADAWPTIIVCDSGMALPIKQEATRWIGTEAHVVTGKDFDFNAKLYIVSYMQLHKNTGNLIKIKPQCLIIDESHAIKEPESLRSRAALRLADKARPRYRWLASATPMPRGLPRELIHQAKTMGTMESLGGVTQFVREYIGPQNGPFPDYDKVVESKMDKLHREIRRVGYIRRERKHLPGGVPDVTEMEIMCPPGRNYPEAWEWAEEQMGMGLNGMPIIGPLMLASAKDKLPHVLEWIDQHKDLGELPTGKKRTKGTELKKTLVFCRHLDVVQQVVKKFKGESVYVTGEVVDRGNKKDRNDAVRAFQEDDRVRIFVGTYEAAGRGLTLTAADKVICLEPPLSPHEYTQANGRAFGRANDPHGGTSIMFSTRGSVDEYVRDCIFEPKKRTIEQVVHEVLARAVAEPPTKSKGRNRK